MRKAKKRELIDIAVAFQGEYDQLHVRLKENVTGIKAYTENLDAIRKLHDVVQKFPVWPFEASKLAQFLVTIVIPLLMAVATNALAELVTKYLK